MWLDLLDPVSQASLRRLLQAPLLRDRSFGSQLLDSWAGGQLLDEVGNLLTTADGRSTTALLQATLRQQLLQRRQVTLLSLLRGLPEQRLSLRIDALVVLAEQWRRQIRQQQRALQALQQLELPRVAGRTPYLGDLPAAPRPNLLPVAHRREPLPLELLSGPLHLLAFTPRGFSASEADGWSVQTRQQLLERQLMLSRPLHAGRHHLKAVLGNPYTAEAQLQSIACCVAESLTPLAVSAQP